MALYKPLIGSAMSGKLGGLVASHNAGGQYFRSFVVPTDPGSSFQVGIRDAVASLSAAWLTELDEDQREAWRVYAANVPLLNRLGDSRPVSGIAQYVRSNVPRIQCGLPRVDDGPTVYTLADLTAPAATLIPATDEVSVAFTDTDEWATAAGGALLVYASRPQNETIMFFKGPYRLAGEILGAGTPPTSPAVLDLPFAVTAGQKVFLQFRSTTADGRLSSPFRSSSLAP